MEFVELPLQGAFTGNFNRFVDNRGMFERVLCTDLLKQLGLNKPIVQVNRSITKTVGTIRGMHYQIPPSAETKIIRCIRGKIFDVIIDLRSSSPTFLHWHGVELSADNVLMMYVPEGCAHGFQTLEPDSELLYFHTATYNPEYERAVRFDDPKVNIQWPLSVSEVSERDRSHPWLPVDFTGIVL